MWLGSVVVRMLDLQSKDCGFNSWMQPCAAATLGKLFTHMPSASEVTTIWCYRKLIFFFNFSIPKWASQCECELIINKGRHWSTDKFFQLADGPVQRNSVLSPFNIRRLDLLDAFFLSLFRVISPGEPGLADLLKLRMMEVVVTNGAISRAKLQSNRHHQQTNTQLFTGRMPSQQC